MGKDKNLRKILKGAKCIIDLIRVPQRWWQKNASLWKKFISLGLVIGGIWWLGFGFGFYYRGRNQLCLPIFELPYPLRRLFAETILTQRWADWEGRVLFAKVLHVLPNQLYLETKNGNRRVQLSNKTRFLEGVTPVPKARLWPGRKVVLLLDAARQTALLVIIQD